MDRNEEFRNNLKVSKDELIKNGRKSQNKRRKIIGFKKLKNIFKGAKITLYKKAAYALLAGGIALGGVGGVVADRNIPPVYEKAKAIAIDLNKQNTTLSGAEEYGEENGVSAKDIDKQLSVAEDTTEKIRNLRKKIDDGEINKENLNKIYNVYTGIMRTKFADEFDISPYSIILGSDKTSGDKLNPTIEANVIKESWDGKNKSYKEENIDFSNCLSKSDIEYLKGAFKLNEDIDSLKSGKYDKNDIKKTCLDLLDNADIKARAVYVLEGVSDKEDGSKYEAKYAVVTSITSAHPTNKELVKGAKTKNKEATKDKVRDEASER